MANTGSEEIQKSVQKENQKKEDASEKCSTQVEGDKVSSLQDDNTEEVSDNKEISTNSSILKKEEEIPDSQNETDKLNDLSSATMETQKLDVQKEDHVELLGEMKSLNTKGEDRELDAQKAGMDTDPKKNLQELHNEEEVEEPVFDGTEVPEMEANSSSSNHSLDRDENAGSQWPEKAVALKNFVKVKSVDAVSTFLRRLSGRSDDGQIVLDEENKADNISNSNDGPISLSESELQQVSPKPVERSVWNPLSLIRTSNEANEETQAEKRFVEKELQQIVMKGRIILYTKLGCQDCREARLFLHWKRLRYVEINLDVYPSRKVELERIAGSPVVPRVFFNEVLIGGLSELKGLHESGKLDDKIDYIVTEEPSFEAPLPPVSGEDDDSSVGIIDELAITVKKMKESIGVKDRFHKFRRFTNTFVGSEAVDFLSEDQYLEREEAIEFGRKLAQNLFFQHVLEENVFEDGNHLYRFLDDDPIVSQCQNISKGIILFLPKPIVEISSRLRLLCSAIFEAYASEDGKHVDYKNLHGSEEFARYLRIVEELQRVDLDEMPKEEKLAFFINLYNMMAIHAILVLGHPAGPLERRKVLGDFKYVIGGSTYSLSAIHNGVLRGNQRPPYNLVKPFGTKDRRFKVALPDVEPLINFALVCGNRSGPALRCYSPGNIDKELIEAAREFLQGGGLSLDPDSKIAHVTKILKWYSADFGKNETEVIKHVASYLDPEIAQPVLDLLASTHLKVVYQPYDWGLNC
jgi:glutaredoxin